MIIDNSRKPDFYIVTGDKGYPIAYYKDESKIVYPDSAADSFAVIEGYFDDVTIAKMNEAQKIPTN